MRHLIFSVLTLAAFAISSGTSHASMVSLISGNGSVGSTDTKITYAAGPSSGAAWGSTLDAADFLAARTGSAANIISGNSAWKSQLAGSTAQWVSTTSNSDGSSGSTALYAIDFSVGPGPIAAATLDFRFLVDNDLGDAGQGGLYLNETALANSTRRSDTPDFYKNDQSFSQFDVASELIANSTNTLYVYVVNVGNNPSGLQFDAKFNVTPVPEPTSLALFGLAMVGFARRRR